jgi:hypothetical protein
MAADDHRSSGELGTTGALDRDEEGVEIDVRD